MDSNDIIDVIAKTSIITATLENPILIMPNSTFEKELEEEKIERRSSLPLSKNLTKTRD